jgi:hypothetical protein
MKLEELAIEVTRVREEEETVTMGAFGATRDVVVLIDETTSVLVKAGIGAIDAGAWL